MNPLPERIIVNAPAVSLADKILLCQRLLPLPFNICRIDWSLPAADYLMKVPMGEIDTPHLKPA